MCQFAGVGGHPARWCCCCMVPCLRLRRRQLSSHSLRAAHSTLQRTHLPFLKLVKSLSLWVSRVSSCAVTCNLPLSHGYQKRCKLTTIAALLRIWAEQDEVDNWSWTGCNQSDKCLPTLWKQSSSEMSCAVYRQQAAPLTDKMNKSSEQLTWSEIVGKVITTQW